MHSGPPLHLIEGYRQFRKERYPAEAARFEALAKGQSPRTMIIGCADSRVGPSQIFSAAPGQLFVVRNIAALVPPCEEHGAYHGTSAALEFAVTVLQVAEIVVMGHGLCGGVAAALAAEDNRPVGRFIAPWVALLAPAQEQLGAEEGAAARQRTLEHLGVRLSLRNLQSFPFVADAVSSGRLALHGAWFSIAEGELHWLNRETGDFGRVGA